MRTFDLSVLFFLQLGVLATCRLVGALALRIGQPPVVMATPIFDPVYGRRGRLTGAVGIRR